MMRDPVHYPAPGGAVPVPGWEPKRLATPEDLRAARPAARHWMPVLRVARRAGRGRGL